MKNNWEIGRLLVEAQGGKDRAVYGNELIKKWSKEFTKNYGKGYTFVGSQVKINNYFIDILLFNIEFNSYVVLEFKIRKLKVEDKMQVQLYMKLVDENLKKSTHNKTIGIIISKEQNGYIVNFVKSENIFPLTYVLENK